MDIENFCDGHNCSRCGNCCSMFVPITRNEEKRIREFIKLNNITPENLFVDNKFYSLCCFYDRHNKCCKIYPVRPKICRTFKCNKDTTTLLNERNENHKKAYWNHIGDDGNIRHVTSFDLLFYKDPRPLLSQVFHEYCDENGNISIDSYNSMIKRLTEVDLGYLANCIQVERSEQE